MSANAREETPRRGPWRIESSTPVYANPWIEVVEYQVTDPGGRPGIYGQVSPRNWAIGVLPIFDDGTTVLVGQHRFTFDAWSWELPEGGGPKETKPLESARRELREETGLTAQSWQEMGRMQLSNSTSDEVSIHFLAWDLTEGSSALESTEADMRTLRLPFAQVLDQVLRGEVLDSLTVAMVLHVEVLRHRNELPLPVAAALR